MKKILLVAVILGFGIILTSCEKEGCGCQNFGLDYNENNLKVYFPQAFSPDGDNQNDAIRPFFGGEIARMDPANYKLYLKSGEDVIFSTTSMDAAWDGMINGSPAPAGEYRVFIKFSNSGDVIDKTFRLQLYRKDSCGIPASASEYKFPDQYTENGPVNPTSQAFCPN